MKKDPGSKNASGRKYNQRRLRMYWLPTGCGKSANTRLTGGVNQHNVVEGLQNPMRTDG